MSAREGDADFTELLRSAGLLAFGRQVGSVVFMGAVLALPALASRPVVDDFIWAYFASLFLSSILNLGLERAVGPAVARGDSSPLSSVLRPILRARLYTTPLTGGALWILFRFVGVRLEAAAWALTLVWVVAIQVHGVAFAGLRARGRPRVEPAAALASRVAEAAAVLVLGAAGAGITVLVGAMALVEALVAVVAVRRLGPTRTPIVAPVPPLPWRTISGYAVVELLAFAYLRVDMALVGNLLGPGPGATYGLVYRVIDALTGLATPVLLLLFPYAARLVVTGEGLWRIRERALRLLPAAAVLLTVLALFGAAPVAAAVSRFGEGLASLRILLIAVPMYFVNAIELHLRSAEDRNGEVVAIGTLVLVLNVALNLVLIPRFGLNGAAWALTATETAQLVLVMLVAHSSPTLVRRWGTIVIGYAGILSLVAVLLNAHHVIAGAVLSLCLVGVVVSSMRAGVREMALRP